LWVISASGFVWSRLRADVHRMSALKLMEMRLRGRELSLAPHPLGKPHPAVKQILPKP